MNVAVHTFGESNSDDDHAADIDVNDDIPEHMDVQQEIAEEYAALEADRYQAAEHPDLTTWLRYIVIKRAAGTGKTHVIDACINICITQGLSPTGKLATEYHAKFGNEITAETIHSAFHFPVSRTERPTINWALSAYDIVVAEASMVSLRIC